MHIKKIVIQGFKTYKNTTVVDDLSPKFNVVLGRNGSGKSNFFSAVRFVLSDAYTNMSRDERQGLIHEGLGTVMLAFVEIVFDNGDGRFPIGRNEISIRRTIGLKKDDYSLDGKLVNRSDVVNLLESAGFSRSNPYYIVPQGKITALTNSRDSDRLKLLKEVSGASIFERKLKESMKEMKNNDYKIERIDEALGAINVRLADLQIESTDLQRFQGLEKLRKIYEFNLYDRELRMLHLLIYTFGEEYLEIMRHLDENLKDLELRENLCLELTHTINELKTQLSINDLEKDQLKSEFEGLLADVTVKKVTLSEWNDALALKEEGKTTRISTDIENVLHKLEDNERSIAELKPKLERLRNEESNLKEKLMVASSTRRNLYSKQNRFKKFTHKEARDEWLQTHIVQVESNMAKKTRLHSEVSEEISKALNAIELLRNEKNALEAEVDDSASAQAKDRLSKRLQELRTSMDKLVDKRKQLWREEVRYKGLCDSLMNDVNKSKHMVNQTMSRQQALGIETVRRLANELDLTDKVFGTVAELLTVSDRYRVATEVILGNALFDIVVDTDATATLLIDKMSRAKIGRVTFIPLTRVPRATGVNFPQTQKCTPLIGKLNFDGKFENLMQQLCGNVVVCADLGIASELAKAYKLIGITIDGDRADTRGVISGGYRDHKKSRLQALQLEAKSKGDYAEASQAYSSLRKNIDEVLAELTSLHNQHQLVSRELNQFDESREPKRLELVRVKSEIVSAEQSLQDLRLQEGSLKLVMTTLSNTLQEYKAELTSDFDKALSPAESEQIQRLTAQIEDYESQLDEVVSESNKMEELMLSFETEILRILQPKLQKLYARQAELEVTIKLPSEIADLELHLSALEKKIDDTKDRLMVVSNDSEKLKKEISTSEENLNKLNALQLKMIALIEELTKTSGIMLSKKATLEQRQDELNVKVRELGVLPEEAFNKETYGRVSSNDMLKELKSINEKLVEFSHINKKALEQFHNFTRQSEDLNARRDELTTAKTLIEKLMLDLNHQKETAIITSFQKIAEAFTKIFSKLVPRGSARLELARQSSDSATEESHDLTGEELMENYLGVSIIVSFNSQQDEQQHIEQLLGGQKSLCAIALIFAIQISDPAPFYLLDEIDANLDQQYRSSVALMIKKLSNDAQFICTTFRPEMIQSADKFYGVMYSNKVSTIEEVSKEEALNFVDI